MGTGVSPKRIATRNLLLSKCFSTLSYSFFSVKNFIFCSLLTFLRYFLFWQLNSNATPYFFSSLERRWSSRRFSYGYLVTTSPQLSDLPSAAPSLRLGHWLRAFPTPMVWRAVCTRPGNVFTAAFWSAITSDSSFVQAGCSLQSELGRYFWVLLRIAPSLPFVTTL